MTDLLADAASFLADELADHLSQTVTYRRGGQSVSLAATPGDSRAEIDQQFGILNLAPKDWIIKTSLLVLGGSAVLPQKNDLIEEADGTQWQVLSNGIEPEWRYSGPGTNMLRIHTKRVTVGD